MADSKKGMMDEILESLSSSGNVEGAAIITRDGLLIDSRLSGSVDADTFAAMAATMTGAAETALNSLTKEDAERVIVESRKYRLVTVGAGDDAVVVCLITGGANLGLVLLEINKAADKTAKLMSENNDTSTDKS